MTEVNSRLLVSACWDRLEQELVSVIEQEKTRDILAPVVVLAGSKILAQNLELNIYPELSHKGIGINVRFLVFPQLAQALELTNPFPEFKPIASDSLKWLMVKNLLKSLPPENYFSRVKDYNGLCETIINEYKDFKDGLIMGEEMKLLAEALAKDNTEPKQKALFELFKSLDQRLRDYEQEWEQYLRAIDMAERFSKVFGAIHFLVYGFYDFTAIQRKLVSGIARHTRMTAFMLKPEKEDWFFEYARRVFEFYKNSLGLKPEYLKPEFTKTNLSVFKKALSTGEKTQLQSDQSVCIIFAPGIDREVLEICREIMRLVKKEGLKFDEIGVLVRDYESYSRALQEAFEIYGIPYFLANGKAILEFSAIRTAMKLLSIPEENYSRQDVISVVSSQCFKGATSELAGLFDVISREAFIVNGKDEWEKRLDEYISSLKASLKREERALDEDEDKEQSKRRKGLIEKKIQASQKLQVITKDLFQSLERIKSETSWKEMVELAENLLGKYVDLDFDQEPELRESLKGIFDEIEELEKTKIPADYGIFLVLIERAFGAQTVPHGKFRQGGVCLSELMLARGVRFKAVILPGLCEGSFPLPIQEKPLCSDEERERINQLLEKHNGKAYLSLKRQQPLEERFLFFLACQQADKFLVLSAPWLSFENNQEKPASFILYYALEKLFSEDIELDRIYEIGKEKKQSWIRKVSISEFFPDKSERALNKDDWENKEIAKSQDNLDAIRHLLKEPSIIRLCELAQERWLSKELGSFSGFFGADEFYKKNLDRVLPETFSPHKLESYFSCPFRYLMERILEVSELGEPARRWDFERHEQGTLLHTILHKLFCELKNQTDLRDREKFFNTLKEVIFRDGKKYLLEELLAPELITDLELDEAEAFLAYWHQDIIPSEEFNKWQTELWIKEKTAELELDTGEKVYLSGKIDRLAKGKDALEITDYKFGSADDLSKKPLQQFQLPIYLLSALNLAPVISPEKIRARFLVMDTKGLQKPESIGVSGIMLDELRAKLGEWIKRMREGIKQGFFVPNSEGKKKYSKCTYCAYPALCFGTSGDWAQKLKNNRLKEYKEFLEDNTHKFSLEKEKND